MTDENHPLADSAYLSVLSHQLKSPIHTIQSLLKTISEGYTGEVNAKTRFLIDRAVQKAADAQDMIRDVLDYEYYNQNNSVFTEKVDVLAILKSLLSSYSAQASARGISIHSQIPGNNLIIIQGNSNGLSQAVRNLLDNALKYTPEGGSVSVQLALDRLNKQLSLDIIDTGFGIPDNELGSIFQPFFRSVTHKANIPGTGLGLPITKKIIERHNGQIKVSSELNKGSTFTVTLPYLSVKQTSLPKPAGKRVVIIGGVTAGPKAAARLRRLDESAEITIIEKSEFLSYSGCGLPYYISGQVQSPKALMTTADNTLRDVHFFESIKNIRILKRTEALAFDRRQKSVEVQDLVSGKIYQLPYDVLVLATGGQARIPPIPGINQEGIYSLYNIEDAEAIKKQFSDKNAHDVCIIGGGLIGIETAESLMRTGARVTIFEKQENILENLTDADFALKIEYELNKKGVKVLTGTTVKKIDKNTHGLLLATDKGDYHADLIILSTGVRPNSALARRAGLAINPSGGIKIDQHLRTPDPNIYAIGDCAESINLITGEHKYWPLGSISTKMGRIAADNIAGLKTVFNGFICTAMFKIFDTFVARTGLPHKTALESGFEAESVVITGLDKSHYYGDAKYVYLKLTADKKTHVVLGAQGFGEGDIVSKIEVLACAITKKMTLKDIFQLDLGYSPAYNNPIDFMQTACLVLENKITGRVKTITVADFTREKDEFFVVDVSPLSDYSFTSIPESINIPLENIRSSGIPFGPDKKIVLYSRTSSGAYEAYRYLSTLGYKALFVLEGGLLNWLK